MPATRKVTRTTTKKAAPTQEEAVEGTLDVFADEFIELIKTGSFDGQLGRIDDAVTVRIAQHNDEKAAAEQKSTTTGTTRTVPQPTRKSASPAFVPEIDGTYVISGGNKSLEGKKVKFLRFRKDAKDKAVVEMLDDAPGFPKGKKTVIPVAALKKVAVGRRPVVKKSAKKKGK
jgi:hypothetical protein